MKRINLSKITFWAGLFIFICAFSVLAFGPKHNVKSQSAKNIAQSEIREKRIAAINNALANHKTDYSYEVPGSNMLMMPTSVEEGTQIK